MEKKKVNIKKILLWVAVGVLALALIGLIVAVCLVDHAMNQIGSSLPTETFETIPPHEEDFETDPPEETEPSATTQPTEPSDGTDPTEDTDPTEGTETTTPTETTPPATQPNVTFVEVEQLSDPNVFNILLIGQDTRQPGVRARSDTMIMLSINKNNNTISMTSFMRDLYVQIPGGYSPNRINASFRFGGQSLLRQTIQKNFGITADAYVSVDFGQFQTIIDILGGVDVELSAKEAAHMRSELGHQSIVTGVNHLNGAQALDFCRIRKIDSDHNRTERQRRVLTALAQAAKGMGFSEAMQLVNKVLPYVETDLTDSQIISNATSALGILAGGGKLQSAKIPMNGAYSGAFINGMSVIVPHQGPCSAFLKAFIYGQ